MFLATTRRSFTLVEILVVIIILGILAGLALPQYAGSRERTLDKEAKSNLMLLQVAEEVYKMEKGYYYPNASSTSVISNINTNLKLGLPINQANWTYAVNNTVPGSERATATRVGAGARVWTIYFPTGSSDVPTCSGSGCP